MSVSQYCTIIIHVRTSENQRFTAYRSVPTLTVSTKLLLQNY